MAEINSHTYIGFDTETTGLNPYLGDKIFSLIFTTSECSYYLNINDRPDHLGNYVPDEYIISDFGPVSRLLESSKLWFIHNAKFDMHHVLNTLGGVELGGTVYCTGMLARLVNNQLPSYSLAYLGTLLGIEKDKTVDKYISKHKLYTEVDVGKAKPRQDKHFNLVPFEIISNYGFIDGELHYQLGKYCLERIEQIDKEQKDLGLPSIYGVLRTEVALTRALFRMEKRGCLFDREYCQKAYYHERENLDEASAKFQALTGEEFQDAAKLYKKVFTKLGLQAGVTDKGNPSYSAENLPDSTMKDIILECRQAGKKANTYWRNYLDLMDYNGVIHCNFRQAGTSTGRMSSSNPNLQNVPKRGEDAKIYPVRKAVIPREGYRLFMIDYQAMEYRLLLDVAGEDEVIARINNEKLDVHLATGEAMGVDRTPAKMLNFMLLYGGGADKLASALGILVNRAKELKSLYFRSLKKVKWLTKALTDTAKRRGFLVNWAGRRLELDVGYRMPNHYIQGGCGDICKKAMVKVDQLLLDHESNMLLQVHDELILEIKHGEESLIPTICSIMENVYPHNSLPMEVGVDLGADNWHDKKEYHG